MERKVHWIAATSDRKVGPVMVSYSPLETCPDSCGFKTGGCYAWELFYLRVLGEKIGDGRIKPRSLQSAYGDRKAKARIVRHRVAGDIVGDVDATIEECEFVDDAGLINIGYTHHWKSEEAQPLKGYFRASCNSIEEAEEAIAMGWAVSLTVYGEGVPKRTKLAGQTAFLCPAKKNKEDKSKDINCNSCTLCKVTDKTRDKIVMFETHGGSGTIGRANASSVNLDLLDLK